MNELSLSDAQDVGGDGPKKPPTNPPTTPPSSPAAPTNA